MWLAFAKANYCEVKSQKFLIIVSASNILKCAKYIYVHWRDSVVSKLVSLMQRWWKQTNTKLVKDIWTRENAMHLLSNMIAKGFHPGYCCNWTALQNLYFRYFIDSRLTFHASFLLSQITSRLNTSDTTSAF